MTIVCDDFATFMKTIAHLVERGLTFEAYAATLIITLKGGY